VSTLPPSSAALSAANWATLPEPEISTLAPWVSRRAFDEVDGAVAGGFRAHQAAAVGQALAGEYAGGVVAEFLHHAGHEADLARAHADVAGRHVGVRAEVAVQLQHQRLTEAHHLALALALGVEVRAALAAAHGQGGQRVLEGLLEGQELQDRQVHRGVEAHAALERADGRAVLHAEGAVDVGAAAVVGPGHAELDDPFRFHQAFEQAMPRVLRVLLQERPEAEGDFLDRLQELGLVRVAAGDVRKERVGTAVVQGHCS